MIEQVDSHEIAVAVGRVLRYAFCGGGVVAPDVAHLVAMASVATGAAQALADALLAYTGPGEHSAQRWQARELANSGAAHLRGSWLDLTDLLALLIVSPSG